MEKKMRTESSEITSYWLHEDVCSFVEVGPLLYVVG